jgi:hypothetical protein
MKKVLFALLVLALIIPATSFAAAEPVVSRAIFSTSLNEREPVNDLVTVPHGEKAIFFFTEILNADTTSVTHLWTYNDIEIARIKLNIGSDKWRTWSSKQIWHLTPGEVKVQVLDADNMILAEKTLTIANKE